MSALVVPVTLLDVPPTCATPPEPAGLPPVVVAGSPNVVPSLLLQAPMTELTDNTNQSEPTQRDVFNSMVCKLYQTRVSMGLLPMRKLRYLAVLRFDTASHQNDTKEKTVRVIERNTDEHSPRSNNVAARK